jgi:hypothetical protein
VNLYQTYEISHLHEVDFPASNTPTTLRNAFDCAARKTAETWLVWNNDFVEDYEGSQANFNHVPQPSPWGVD